MKKYILLLITVAFFVSCEKPLEYKYSDKKQIEICGGINTKLANEAYYSFREDLAKYAKKTQVNIDFLDYQYGMALYIYQGASGGADYKAIASQHSIDIFKKLQKEKQIWDNPSTGKLNYHSEFIDCLMNHIQKEEIKSALLSLREINSIEKVSLAEEYRTSIKNAETDMAYAMFLAFETYYKNFSKFVKQ